MSVSATWQGGWWLISMGGDVEFRDVTRKAIDSDGNTIIEDIKDPLTGATVKVEKMISVIQQQVRVQIRISQQVLNATSLNSEVGDTQTAFNFRVSPTMQGAFTGRKRFICQHDELVEVDSVVGLGEYVQDWVYYEPWEDCADWMQRPSEAPESEQQSKALPSFYTGGTDDQALAALNSAGEFEEESE